VQVGSLALDVVRILRTIEREMRTQRDVASVLFGRARRALLGWLLGHADQEFFLRELVRQTGLSPGSVTRELGELVAAGLVARRSSGRQVYFRADQSSPVFPELQSLFLKTAGLVDVLRVGLSPLSDRIAVSFVYGSAARRELRNDSDVDLMVVGNVSFGEVVEALAGAQRTLGREINPTVYPLAEFQAKVSAGHHFVTSVMKTDVLFVIGGRDDLEAVGAGQQVAGGAHHLERGDRQPARRRRPKPARQPRRRPQR